MGPSEETARNAIRRHSIGCEFSHFWSDALFARERARECDSKGKSLLERLENSQGKQAGLHERSRARARAEIYQYRWDLGSYVRWAVQTAYMAFERACCDATDDPEVSRNLPKKLPSALSKKGVTGFSWTDKPWNQVDLVRQLRVKFTHLTCTDADLLAPLSVAEEAIKVLREATLLVYDLVGKSAPIWVECDSVPMKLGGSQAWMSTRKNGSDADPQEFWVAAIYGDGEWDYATIRGDEDPWPSVKELAVNIKVPVSGIRIYQGGKILHDLDFRVRGSTPV